MTSEKTMIETDKLIQELAQENEQLFGKLIDYKRDCEMLEHKVEVLKRWNHDHDRRYEIAKELYCRVADSNHSRDDNRYLAQKCIELANIFVEELNRDFRTKDQK